MSKIFNRCEVLIGAATVVAAALPVPAAAIDADEDAGFEEDWAEAVRRCADIEDDWECTRAFFESMEFARLRRKRKARAQRRA
jgi:hypothetical protein